MNMTEIFEYDQKMTATNMNLLNMTENFDKNCPNGEHERLNMTEIIFSSFSQIQSFLVEFNKLTLIVFPFRSCSNRYGSSVLVIFKPNFGHIHSVKLTSLQFFAKTRKLEGF